MNAFQKFEHQIQEEKNEIKELKALITRAADALVLMSHDYTALIAELRKAAE